MKKLALLTLMIACVAFVFVSCAGGGAGGVDIVINENDPTVVKDGSTLAPNTMVKFAWTDPNGNPVTCDVILEKDGVKVEEFEGVTEVLTGIREEGHYKAYIIPVNASGSRAAKIIRFTVNKMYEELYKEDSGRYQWVDVSEACYNAYLEEENAKIYFYKLEGKVVENINPENTNEMVYLTFVDSNSDGILDGLQEWTPGETRVPLTLPVFPTPWGLAVVKDIQYSDGAIKVITLIVAEGEDLGLLLSFNSPYVLAEVGLELNTLYSTLIMSDTYNSYPYLSYFEDNLYLSERYDSDTMPEFSLIEETNASESRGASITVNVTAPNVADFATLYNTEYMQIAVSYPASLTLDTVDFDNFVEGSKEFTSYKIIDDIWSDDKIVLLYRGLVPGADELSAVSDFFATLNFEAPDSAGNGEIGLAIDWDYTFAYGPMFRDNENKHVDGFIMDYEPLAVTW